MSHGGNLIAILLVLPVIPNNGEQGKNLGGNLPGEETTAQVNTQVPSEYLRSCLTCGLRHRWIWVQPKGNIPPCLTNGP